MSNISSKDVHVPLRLRIDATRQILQLIRGDDVEMFTIPTGPAGTGPGGASIITRDEEALQALRLALKQDTLRGFLADEDRGSNAFGAFVSDTLMKLGLLGTIIGFIIMLAPIATLDAADKVAMRSSMGLMSDGMEVAMYTTLAGLIGSISFGIRAYRLAPARIDRQP